MTTTTASPTVSFMGVTHIVTSTEDVKGRRYGYTLCSRRLPGSATPSDKHCEKCLAALPTPEPEPTPEPAKATVKVVTVSNAKGDTEVHAPGCADLKKKNRNYSDAYTWSVGSAVELSHDFWNDQIGDTVDPDSAEGWATAESWVGTFHFLPCCPAFPADQAAEPVVAAPAAVTGMEHQIRVGDELLGRTVARIKNIRRLGKVRFYAEDGSRIATLRNGQLTPA